MKSVTSQRRRFASGRAGRTLVALLALLLVVALVAIAVGCGGDDGGTAASPSAGGAIKTGGVLKIGSQPGNVNFDPALFAGAVPDILLQQQIYEKLVTLGQDLSVQPTLATKWDSPDGKVWTFTLRDGVKFSNGQDFTSADVVYTMDRLRSKKLGSAMADVYVNIKDVSATDPTTVTFTLKSVDSEFPASLTDYHTLMLCKTVSDPKKNAVGTGPFVLESISAEDRAILKKNPNYWGTDADGTKLPYLDEIDIVYSPDPAGQIEGLQGGTLNWVGGLTAEQKQAVEANTSLKTITTNTNYCFELQIRTDQKPGSDLKVRQAIMAGTDRQAIVDLVAPGLAEAGNGTLVGPGYKDYYLDSPVPFDQAKAKQLLADAGYANGVKIKLVAQTADPVPAIATAWQAQMKEIGIDVSIQQVPPDVFYAYGGPGQLVPGRLQHRRLRHAGCAQQLLPARPRDRRVVQLLALERPGLRQHRQADRAGARRHQARRPLQAGAADPAGPGADDELPGPDGCRRPDVDHRRHRHGARLAADALPRGAFHRMTRTRPVPPRLTAGGAKMERGPVAAPSPSVTMETTL